MLDHLSCTNKGRTQHFTSAYGAGVVHVSVLPRVKYGDVSDCFMYNAPSRLHVDVSDSMFIPATLFCLFIISCAAEGGSVRCYQTSLVCTLILLSLASARPLTPLNPFLVCLILLLQPFNVLIWRSSPLAWAFPREIFLAGLFQQYYVKQSRDQVGESIRGASLSPELFGLLNV